MASFHFVCFFFFSCFCFSHIHRYSNSVAHKIAKYARYVSGLIVWMEDVLPHIMCSSSSQKKKKKKKPKSHKNKQLTCI